MPHIWTCISIPSSSWEMRVSFEISDNVHKKKMIFQKYVICLVVDASPTTSVAGNLSSQNEIKQLKIWISLQKTQPTQTQTHIAAKLLCLMTKMLTQQRFRSHKIYHTYRFLSLTLLLLTELCPNPYNRNSSPYEVFIFSLVKFLNNNISELV